MKLFTTLRIIRFRQISILSTLSYVAATVRNSRIKIKNTNYRVYLKSGWNFFA